jgi:hypothetical protein
MKLTKKVKARLGLMARMAAFATIAGFGLSHSPAARADTLLKAATTMVYGTSSDTYSITTPSAGTVTASVSSVPWPTALSALSFEVTDATSVLNPTGPDVSAMAAGVGTTQPIVETYQVGQGTYFAHVSATAANNSLNLGLYSVLFTFAPVPLPAAVGLFLFGLAVVLSLRHTASGPRGRNESVMSAA